MTLGATRRLRAVLSANSRPSEVLNSLGYGSLADKLPASVSLDELLSEAEHEARCRRHPYLSSEHVLLAAAKAARERELITEYARALDQTRVRAHRWWQPRGRGSALRARGQRLLDEQQRTALERERHRP
ncbi:Clp protease N-terminal domain-containing protein [Streptomyces hyaluromycini]|uniref:Clp protease N-terminal domain-containing protein n=1 Tax=Streptomyces hyaluromycini TaxID=1377993 RepID=A0ABV1WM64_9ACTN